MLRLPCYFFNKMPKYYGKIVLSSQYQQLFSYEFIYSQVFQIEL